MVYSFYDYIYYIKNVYKFSNKNRYFSLKYSISYNFYFKMTIKKSNVTTDYSQ